MADLWLQNLTVNTLVLDPIYYIAFVTSDQVIYVLRFIIKMFSNININLGNNAITDALNCNKI